MKPRLKVHNPADDSISDAMTLADVAVQIGITYVNARKRNERGQLPAPVLMLDNRPIWARAQFEGEAKVAKAS